MSSSVTSECRIAKKFLPGLLARSAISYRNGEIVCPRCARPKAALRTINAPITLWGEEFLSEQLDAVDAKILDLIQHDAGLSVAEIAERVGLSSSPCWRRIKR
ncbi:MAG TPA: AsnC family protein, partial [Caulobacter sp.]|nr:AsnC family protein [Caulobacter sp.]